MGRSSVQQLSAHEWRREADGSLRVVDAASIRSCRPCPLVSSANGMAARRQNRARSASCCIHSMSGRSRSSGRIGVAENTGVHVGTCCVTNGWRCNRNRTAFLSEPVRLCLFPEQNVRTLGSRGLRGWLAMREGVLLLLWLSPCLACPQLRLIFWVS